MDKPHCLIVHNREMETAQKTSLSALMQEVGHEDLTILIDHALLDFERERQSFFPPELKDMELNALKSLLNRTNPAVFHPCDASCLSAAFDQAFAHVLGQDPQDGLSAWGQIAFKNQFPLHEASSAMQSAESDDGFALLHLCHWQVGAGHVLMNRAGDITPEMSDHLRENIATLFKSEDIELFAYLNDTYIAKSKHFKNLPSASFNKAMNDNVLPWLIGVSAKDLPNANPNSQASIHILRRLQSEVQMHLYDHPVTPSLKNPINSIWFSGTGQAPLSMLQLELIGATHGQGAQLYKGPSSQILCLHGLTQHWHNHDLSAWLHQLQAMDEDILSQCMNHPKVRIVLCGQHGFKDWQMTERNWLQKNWKILQDHLNGAQSTLQVLS